MERKRISHALAAAALGATVAAGCASTEYFNEGLGQPTDRASGVVPAGELGVCKRPSTKRPPIVSQKLWDDAKTCNDRTPRPFLRLGYGSSEGTGDADADRQVELILGALGDAAKEDGNTRFLAMLRTVRDQSAKSARLKDRVARETARPAPCDFAYLLSTMARERMKLSGQRCTAVAYDVKERREECLIDASRDDAVWVTSAWDCVTHTGVAGQEQSCHRLCGYDDYCSEQVSCAANDLDLVMCAMGLCIPEARAF